MRKPWLHVSARAWRGSRLVHERGPGHSSTRSERYRTQNQARLYAFNAHYQESYGVVHVDDGVTSIDTRLGCDVRDNGHDVHYVQNITDVDDPLFERADRIGGLLRYGIPEFKMEKRHLESRLRQMQDEGTRFRAGVEIGKDITARQLRDRFDAVVIATGAMVRRDLPVPGREVSGIYQAMDYLPQANRAARAFAEASGGEALNVLPESMGNRAVTAHLLGGAVIAGPAGAVVGGTVGAATAN